MRHKKFLDPAMSAAREGRMPRQAIRAKLVEVGQAEIADEVTDLAIQAACKALDAFFATADLGSRPIISLNVVSIGLPLLRQELALLERARQFATSATGIRTIDCTVERTVNG